MEIKLKKIDENDDLDKYDIDYGDEYVNEYE